MLTAAVEVGPINLYLRPFDEELRPLVDSPSLQMFQPLHNGGWPLTATLPSFSPPSTTGGRTLAATSPHACRAGLFEPIDPMRIGQMNPAVRNSLTAM